MICYKCGSHVPDGSKTCPTCGNNFEREIKKQDIKAKSQQRIREKIGFDIGDLVAGRYKIKSRIGEGPSGVVFRVLDTEMDVDIALKIIYKSVVGDEAENKKFQTEMRIARKIAHQNIVRVYDIDRDNGYSFYTMQLLEGLSLRKIINLRTEKRQVFSLQEIEPIFIQIVNALVSAQSYTYHGNLKPENVMILPDLLKVCDFCLVKAIGREKFNEINASNEIYIAPEVRFNWDIVDSRADIYSMAVIIYEMVTGERFTNLPVSASLKNPNVPKAIDNFLNKALSTEQDRRFDSLEEFVEEFKKVVDKEASSSYEAGPEDEEFIEISTDDFELIETHEREKTRKRLPKDRIFFSVEEELKKKREEEEREKVEGEEEVEKPQVQKRAEKKVVQQEDVDTKEDILVKKRQSELPLKDESKATSTKEPKAHTPRKEVIPPSSSSAQDSKSMIIPMMILVVVLAVLGGGIFLLYKVMENQRERDRMILEQQRMEIEKQKIALEKYQQELLAQLEAAKKAIAQQAKQESDKPKTPDQIKKEEEEKKRLMELEARLSELQREKENLDKKREEIKIKERPLKKEEKPKFVEEAPKRKDKLPKESEVPKRIEVVSVDESSRVEPKKTEEMRKEEPKVVEEAKVEEKKEEPVKEEKAEESVAASMEKKSQCPRGMVLIPEGEFTMGSSPSDPMRGFGEKNNTQVYTHAYCIDIFEYPNKRGATPKTNIAPQEAEALCQKVGKRLCTEAVSYTHLTL
ncbi:MAG: protein kinase, partial [Deltaproteobacteria bacterium]|nr:protein kinase [Deltaproteobacteria bacterium]